MTVAGKKRTSGSVSDRPKSKKRLKLGIIDKSLANDKQIKPPNENIIDIVTEEDCNKKRQIALPSETDCNGCSVASTCSVACNVSCDGSDDCTAPEPCNDPSCEGDPCWEGDCEKYDCTDQSCRANQCRIEPCSQEACFEDINSSNHELYDNNLFPCWDLCQSPNRLLCLQNCVIGETDASKVSNSVTKGQSYPNYPSEGWTDHSLSHPNFPPYESISNESLQLPLQHNNHENQKQNSFSSWNRTDPEIPYPSYDINDLIAVTSTSNCFSAPSDKDLSAFNKDTNSHSHINNAFTPNTEYHNHWSTSIIENGFEPATKGLASNSNRLSVSTAVSSPLDMIAAAAEHSAGIDFPYVQQNFKKDAEQISDETIPLNSRGSQLPNTKVDRLPSGDRNPCFCKWKLKKGDLEEKLKLCNKGFDTEEALWIHVKSDHTSALINKYTCQWHGCVRPGHFGTKSKLERHLLPHTGYKEHKCPICNAAFSLKQQVENHIRIHTGDTPFKCDECGQTFRTAQARDDHKRRHKGVRQFKCRVCGLACTDASNRSKHERTHRLEAYECRHEGCKTKAKRWDNIKRHFEHMGHCLELLHDPKAQQKYKREAEVTTMEEAQKEL